MAISLFKLMAYKDEYEVARLYAETGFFDRIAQQFEGDYRLRFHLAPPLLARRNAQGQLVKRRFGSGMATAFKWLAKARFVRGTPLDVFGYTDERRQERRAAGEFQALMRHVADALRAETVATALALARLPQTIRGYGHVKTAQEKGIVAKQDSLLASLGQWQSAA